LVVVPFLSWTTTPVATGNRGGRDDQQGAVDASFSKHGKNFHLAINQRCDFDFLRPNNPAKLPFVAPIV
jgi:hypothetical protein